MSTSEHGDDLSQRLIDLEVKLAYQDRVITSLDEVVRELAARVAVLEAAAAAPPVPVP